MYSRILVPYDGSTTSQRGLDEAIRIARGFNGELQILHVLDDISIAFAVDACYADATGWQRQLIEAAARTVSEAEGKARSSGVAAKGSVVDNGVGSMGDCRSIRRPTRHRSDRHGHAWPTRAWARCDGQRR